MKKQFKIIEIDNEIMTLEVNHSGGCHSCEANSSCGTGILANYFNHYKPYQSGVSVGDFVTLEIPLSELFLRAFMLYIAPILALFLGGAIGMMLFPQQEFWHILFSGAGFILALFGCRWFFK